MKSFGGKLLLRKRQTKILEKYLEGARQLYNAALTQRIETYKTQKKSLSKYDQQKLFKKYLGLPATLIQITMWRLDGTYQRFFKQGNKFPKFKSADEYKSFELRQYQRDFKILDEKHVRFWQETYSVKGLNNLKGIPQTARIKRRADGWYIQIVCKVENKEPLKEIKKAIGIDCGLKYLIADSDGNVIEPPKYYRKAETKLGKTQKNLNRKSAGSNRRNNIKNLLAKQHLKIERQRRDFNHKIAQKLVQENDFIVAEKLNIEGMARNHHLAKSIKDASWDDLLRKIQYKAEEAGKYFIQVDPAYTSQKCNKCGEMVAKSLSTRTHICSYCGYVEDRDVNAAKNILTAGHAVLREMDISVSVKSKTPEL